VLQLMTYCLLVEDQMGARPPYGLLRYADATLRIPYTDDLRQQVLDTADAIRTGRRSDAIHRQHDDAYRCRGCGYRSACGDEAL
jgi:CRISPR-associated exonuclease Cas4